MPLIKLGYLLIRTVAKPVANILKRQTKDNPAFRSICVRLAQRYHRTEIQMSRRLGGASKTVTDAAVRPLDEQRAIELGANFLGETLVFLVAGTVLILDQTVSAQKEYARRQVIEAKFSQLFNEIEVLKEGLEHSKQTARVIDKTKTKNDNSNKLKIE
jgi:optic atrophy 3 protein